MKVLAIDQGTSSTKALVIGGDGAILGEGRAAVNPVASANGAVEQDPRELLDSIVSAGKSAIAEAGSAVDVVGLGNQGETVLRWDRASGKALGPAISWQDRRAASVTRGLEDEADRLTAITGLPLDPYFAAPKMTWLRRVEGGGGVVTTIDAWLTHQLTGQFVTDSATASRTMLLDLEELEWSDEACDVFSIDPNELPNIVDCAAVVGDTTAFGDALPVTGLAVDQQAALFAESCFAPGDAKCTYGTGAFILANAGTVVPRSVTKLAACVAWSLDGEPAYCLDGQIYTAGAAISWLESLGLIGSASELDALCAQASPDEAAMFVPALAGLGAPYWAPSARASWTGVSLATTTADLVRSVVIGVAAQVTVLARAMSRDLGHPLSTLRVDGGLTRSQSLMQAQADLLQCPVEVYAAPDATALGVGALARLGAGEANSPRDAVGEWSPAAVFEPSISADASAAQLADWEAAAEAAVQRVNRRS